MHNKDVNLRSGHANLLLAPLQMHVLVAVHK
jgi:hypothetical protein